MISKLLYRLVEVVGIFVVFFGLFGAEVKVGCGEGNIFGAKVVKNDFRCFFNIDLSRKHALLMILAPKCKSK